MQFYILYFVLSVINNFFEFEWHKWPLKEFNLTSMYSLSTRLLLRSFDSVFTFFLNLNFACLPKNVNFDKIYVPKNVKNGCKLTQIVI